MLCSILNYSSYTATFPCLGNVLHITSGINSFFFYKYIYICKSPYFIENGHFSPIYLFYYRSVSELQQVICLCLLAFVFRDTEQLRAAESKLMRWQHAYLPLFSTVSETPLGVSAPWAALNTQQGLQPLPQSLIIFLTFFFLVPWRRLFAPYVGDQGNAWRAAEGWAMSQLRDYESSLTGRPKWMSLL